MIMAFLLGFSFPILVSELVTSWFLVLSDSDSSSLTIRALMSVSCFRSSIVLSWPVVLFWVFIFFLKVGDFLCLLLYYFFSFFSEFSGF